MRAAARIAEHDMTAVREEVHILLVEDNDGDIDLVKEALARFTVPHKLTVITDGESALQSLAPVRAGDDGRLPDLVLLDLNIPRRDGREVLAGIKGNERTAHIPVIVLTSSGAERDRLQAYRLHANCFITKPSDVDSFFEMFRLIEQFWLNLVELPPPQHSRSADILQLGASRERD
jgi:CheY-like chemotaxis protein